MTRHWMKEITGTMLRDFKGKIRTKELDDNGKALLSKLGVTVNKITEPYVVGVNFNLFGKDMSGIGMRNDNGGVEYVDDVFNNPVTIGRRGLTTIKGDSTVTAKQCCIFSSFIDWLAYVDFPNKYIFGIPDNGLYTDCYILNDPSNFLSLLIRSDLYTRVNLFMPVSDYGKVLTSTLESRHGRSIVDCSVFYATCKDFAEYARKFKGDKALLL